MLNGEIKGRQESSPLCLPTIQSFHSHKTLKVVMVCKHLDRMRSAFEVMAELLETLADSQQFTIMGLITALCRVQLSGPKRDRMPLRKLVAI